MQEGVVDFARREFEYLSARAPGPDYLLELVPFIETLRSQPVVAGHLEAMARDADSMFANFEAVDAAQVRAVSEFAKGIDVEAFGPEGTRRHSLDRERLTALVNELEAEHSQQPFDRFIPRVGYADPSRSGKLLERLRHIIQAPDSVQTNDVHASTWVALTRLREEHEHRWRAHAIRAATSPGCALNRLDLVVRQLNPKPEARIDEDGWLLEGFSRVVGTAPKSLRKVVTGELGPVGSERAQVDMASDLLRLDAERVHADLRRRVSARRSRESALREYKLRCSWFDARGMMNLIDEIRDERMKEDRLSDHLALFLFDHGLRPAVRSTVGRLIPDFFEAGASTLSEDAPFEPSFYIEAKQYAETERDARKAVNDGVAQIWSTASRLRARYDLVEAHLVVFRRSGPLLVFDGDATRDGLTVKGHLIDVALGSVSGSKQRDVLHVPATALLGDEW